MQTHRKENEKANTLVISVWLSSFGKSDLIIPLIYIGKAIPK